MGIDWLVGFVAGFIADAARSVLMPTTTAWLMKKLPFTQEEANKRDNIELLDQMAKMKGIGIDPSAVERLGQPTAEFLSAIGYKAEAYKEFEVEVDGLPLTQAEMSRDSSRRAWVARQRVQALLYRIHESGMLSEKEREALDASQAAWQDYLDAQSEFDSLKVEGGSMQPLVANSTYEAMSVERFGQLKQRYDRIMDLRSS